MAPWGYHVAPACGTPQLQTVTAEMRRVGMSAGGNQLDNLRLHRGLWRRGTVARLPKSCLNDLAKIGGAGPRVLRRKVLPPGVVALFCRSGKCLSHDAPALAGMPAGKGIGARGGNDSQHGVASRVRAKPRLRAERCDKFAERFARRPARRRRSAGVFRHRLYPLAARQQRYVGRNATG